MYRNNHVHSAPQSKKEENREERKKNHTPYVHVHWCSEQLSRTVRNPTGGDNDY